MRKQRRDWSECGLCWIGQQARKHCLGRGELPCEVLIVGEAPGLEEDRTGVPFSGESGKLLPLLLSESGYRFSWYATTAVACRPCEGRGEPNRPPSFAEISNCASRLQEIADEARAKHFICLGRVARQWIAPALAARARGGWEAVLCLQAPALWAKEGGADGETYAQNLYSLQEFFKRRGLKREPKRICR